MKEGSGGSHIFISSTTRDPDDRPLMAIGYKYIYQKVLGFIFKEGAGSIVTGVPYLSFYLEDYSNVSIYFVLCTDFLCRYFSEFNKIETKIGLDSMI